MMDLDLRKLLFISPDDWRQPPQVRQDAHCHDCGHQGLVSVATARCPQCGSVDLDWIDDTADAF